MSINFRKFYIIVFLIVFTSTTSYGEKDLKSLGKFKDWESFKLLENEKKICFAQSIPVLKAPKNFKRNPSRLFVTFRPNENIIDEISVTSGYFFQKKSSVTAKSGKKKFDFFSQGEFAWISEDEEEKKFIQAMKKASRVLIIGKTELGKKTTDHYSLMGFTKAYNSAKKNCS